LRDASDLQISGLNNAFPSPDGQKCFKKKEENKLSFEYVRLTCSFLQNVGFVLRHKDLAEQNLFQASAVISEKNKVLLNHCTQ